MFKLDLKDAYLMVPVIEQHHKYLSFQWGQRCFHFTSLPFGLSSAPWIFTKVTRPFVQYLRTRDIRMIIYLDDMLFLHQQEEKLLEARGLALDLLENLGILVNYKKSELSPTQKISFLRIHDRLGRHEGQSPTGEYRVYSEGSQDIPQHTPDISSSAGPHGGHILSHNSSSTPSSPSLSGATIPETQGTQVGGYSSIVTLSEGAQSNQEWWISNLGRMNGQPIQRNQPGLTITTDASVLSPSMGGTLPQLQNRRTLVRGREIPPHKLPQVAGSIPSSRVLLQRQRRYHCSTQDGQFICDNLQQPPWGYKVDSFMSSSEGAIGMVSAGRYSW